MNVFWYSAFVVLSLLSQFNLNEGLERPIENYWRNLVSRIEPPRGNKSVSIDQSLANRFLGYIEGMTKSSVPQHWERCVLNARIFPNRFALTPIRGDVVLRFETVDCAPKDHLLDERASKADDEIQVELVGTRVNVERNPRTDSFGIAGKFLVPEEISEHLIDKKAGLIKLSSVVFDETSVYFSVPNSDLPGATIFCFDKNTKELIWRSTLRNYVGLEFRASSSWFTELVFADNKVLAYSACDAGLSIIELSKKTGDQQILFVWSQESVQRK